MGSTVRLLAAAVCIAANAGTQFSARIVDGLGRPIEGVFVEVTWSHRDDDGKLHQVSLLTLHSDRNGGVRATYVRPAMVGHGGEYIELSKRGYEAVKMIHPFETPLTGLKCEMYREFGGRDIIRIAALNAVDRTPEVRELLGGHFKGGGVVQQIFEMEHVFRPALRDLVNDPQVGRDAISLLAFIGLPEDITSILERDPAPPNVGSDDRWASVLVGAMLEPRSEKEWAFLKRCAEGEFQHPDATESAIITLCLIASPRSRSVLEELHPKDDDLASLIAASIRHIRSRPAPFTDRDLARLSKRVATELPCAESDGHPAPVYNEKRDKAFIATELIANRDGPPFNATFHRVGGLWKLRGVFFNCAHSHDVPSDAGAKNRN